jgi:vancomycin resistance protein YoaR
MTTTTLPRRLISPVLGSPSRRSFVAGFLGTLLVGLAVLVGLSIAIALNAGAGILPGVSVGGVPVAGLDRAAAIERLDAGLPSLSTGHATIVVDGDEVMVGYGELGRGYELEAMADAALDVGRGSDPIGDGIARLRSLVHPTRLPVVVHAYDAEAIDALSIGIAREVRLWPSEGSVQRTGTRFTVVPSGDGRRLDASTVHAALAAAIDNADPADVRIELAPRVQAPVVSTAAAISAAEAARTTAVDLALTIPGAAEDEVPFVLGAEEIASWITFGPVAADPYAVRVDEAAVQAAVAALVAEVDRDPVSARITVAGSGLGGVVPGQTGRVLDVEGTTSGLLGTLGQRGGGAPVASLVLDVDVTDPALTTEAAEAALPQMQLVSSWTTNYVPGDGNGFGANISIGAWDLDGYNIAPGAWFSFWNGIGPVTVERGYQYGGAIINGRSVPNGALAGGICSTSTTLFNAAMRFGLEIGDRTAHYYYIDRYPTGLDATVAIVNDAVTDLTFRNDTEHPIVIRGYGTPGQVTFQMWSVPNGRTVVLGDPVITDRRSAIETTQLDTSLSPGAARRVEYPHHGFKVTVGRTVYGPDGGIIHQNTWFSDYRVVNGITLVGPALPPPPPTAGDDDAGETVGDPPPEEEAEA